MSIHYGGRDFSIFPLHLFHTSLDRWHGTYSELFADKPLRLVTRRSPLAMVQTEMVASLLGKVPHEIIGISTIADEVIDRPLVEIGGKGLFVKALEAELMAGQADCAVHSLKDMETILAPQTDLVAVLPREDRRDCLIGPYRTIADLPQGAIVGTSSVRRASILRHYRPDLKIELLRGNVQRRLSLLAEGRYDAIILAKAGLLRLGMEDVGTAIPESVMMPSASQGVIALQIATQDESRADAMRALFQTFHCQETFLAITAERALLDRLDGSCRTPIGAMADRLPSGELHLQACVLSADGAASYSAEATGACTDPAALGIAVAEQLLEKCGGPSFLA